MGPQKQIRSLPLKPGVYIFRDKSGAALYVGKAVNLRNRVRSYFQKGLELGPRTAAMVEKIKKIEHIVVESEIEALLLEADLIKRLKPKYNVRLKDDKAYQYIKISNVKAQMSKLKTATPEEFAKVTTARKTYGQAIYFGPFPEGKTVRQVLRTLRRVFPFRDCSEAKFKRYQKLGRPCLYGDLELCPAPCVGLISPEDYQKNIKQLVLFLSGRRKNLVEQLEEEMEKASKEKNFEEAARLRDRIRSLEYVTQAFKPAKDYLEHPNLLEDQRQKELEELRKRVGLEKKIKRIEAYDISNIFGEWAVGSLVVFMDGEPDKSQYRRFKIKTVEGVSDVAMIKEVLRRRLKRVQNSKRKAQSLVQSSKLKKSKDKVFENLPDLILVDGGKPQVGAVNEILEEFGLTIPVLGLAKRFERIIKDDLSVIKLPKSSPALHLLQRIRDEAHRFALSYHRKLRSRGLMGLI